MSEQRKHARIKDNLVVICSIPDKTKVEEITISEDISQGGIRLVVPKNFSKEDIVGLSINIFCDAVPISLQGKIVWVKEEKRKGFLKKQKRYSLGIQFSDTDNFSRDRILRYMARKTKRKD